MSSRGRESTRSVVLLVDDEPAAIDVVRDVVSCNGRGHAVELRTVEEGSEALAYVDEVVEGDASLPNLVLLDPSLPDVDGREVLEAIREAPGLGHVPVVVLSRSAADDEALAFYRGHANAYLHKPEDAEDLAAVIGSLEEFWLSTARLPGQVR